MTTNRKAEELLTPTASDRGAGRRLTKREDQDTIIINRPDRPTYPDEKSVLTSGATPLLDRLTLFGDRRQGYAT